MEAVILVACGQGPPIGGKRNGPITIELPAELTPFRACGNIPEVDMQVMAVWPAIFRDALSRPLLSAASGPSHAAFRRRCGSPQLPPDTRFSLPRLVERARDLTRS